MHKYLRAVGFSSIKNIKQLEPLFKSIIEKPDKRIAVCADDSDISAMQIDRDFGEDIGISMVGELDEAGNFVSSKGWSCLIGKRYAQEEVTAPVRTVTALVGVNGRIELLSVKTKNPIP